VIPPEGFSKARVSGHAANEITRRGIPVDKLRNALDAPEQVLAVRPGRVVLHRRYHSEGVEYLLRVFVDIDSTPPMVVTVYRTSKISKYWSTS
jgi:hypothetical protein